jgi:hypothetical protein
MWAWTWQARSSSAVRWGPDESREVENPGDAGITLYKGGQAEIEFGHL